MNSLGFNKDPASTTVVVAMSGGVDSSVISLASMKKIPNLVSYIAVYNEKSKDLKCARQVAEMLNIELIEVKVEPPTVQDIKEIIPELISNPDNDETKGFYAMDDGKMTSVLVKAVQELSARVEELEGK